MTKHLQNIAAVVTILVGIATAIGWFISKPEAVASNSSYAKNIKSATLVISASGIEIKIKKGTSSVPYTGGILSSSGAKQVIYLPVGQQLQVLVSGSGADIGVESSIAQYVNVSSSASGTKVYEL